MRICHFFPNLDVVYYRQDTMMRCLHHPLPLEEGVKSDQSQTPAASQVAPRRTTQRQLRESSVNSDTSSIGTVGRSTRTRATPAATQRKGKTQPIVIEESEDEVNRDLGPARSSTGTARGKSSRATGSGIVGDDEASTIAATGRKATQSSLGTGRRRLVVDDDDDGELVRLFCCVRLC
jgi:hypothetical protein